MGKGKANKSDKDGAIGDGAGGYGDGSDQIVDSGDTGAVNDGASGK